MPELFPIKVKDVTISSEEYENTISLIEELKTKLEKQNRLLTNLVSVGIEIPSNALECKDFMMHFDHTSNSVKIHCK